MCSALVKQKWTDRHPAMIDCYPRSFVTSPSDWSLNWTMNNEQWTDGKNLQYWNVRDINGAIKAIDMTRLPEFKKTNLPRSCKSIGVEIISCQRKPGVSSLFPIPYNSVNVFHWYIVPFQKPSKLFRCTTLKVSRVAKNCCTKAFISSAAACQPSSPLLPSSPPSSPPPPSEWVISQLWILLLCLTIISILCSFVTTLLLVPTLLCVTDWKYHQSPSAGVLPTQRYPHYLLPHGEA